MASTRTAPSWQPPVAGCCQDLPVRTYLAGAAMNLYYVAAIWLGMALLASVIGIRIAVPAALGEIVVGALAGNIPGIREHVTQTHVITFLSSVGSLVRTFLAGAEIDPVSLRGHWKASVSALHCLRAAHPVLLPARRNLDLGPGTHHGGGGDRGPAAGQAGRQDDRRVAGRRRVPVATEGAHL